MHTISVYMGSVSFLLVTNVQCAMHSYCKRIDVEIEI